MKRGLTGILISLVMLPLVSALSYYSNPLDYLNNEWVKFGIIFLLLFVSMYSFLNRRMQNPPVSVIIALGLSALISIPIMQRGLIEPFLSPDIVDWIVIIAIGIALIFLFYKFGMRIDDYGRKRFSLGRLFIFLLLFVFLLYLIGDLLPDTIMYGPIGDWIDIIKGLGWWAIVIAIAVLLIGWWLGRHREKRSYLWKGRYEQKGRQGRGWFGRKKQDTPYYKSQEANAY